MVDVFPQNGQTLVRDVFLMIALIFVASLNEGGTLSFQVMNEENQQSMKPLAIQLFMRKLSKREQRH